MRIASVAITNYKSFLDQQTIHLEPGFNILLGTNNSGKTSILDVLDMEHGLNEPHRSERTIPRYGDQPTQNSELEVCLSTDFNELWRLAGATQLYLPLGAQKTYAENRILEKKLDEFIAKNGDILLVSNISKNGEKLSFKGDDFIEGEANRATPTKSFYSAHIQLNPSSPILRSSIGNHVNANGTAGNYVQLFKSRIYRFNAQRRPGYQCEGQLSAVLDREAIKLPYCLNNLQTNDAHGHRLLCSWVNRVFPSIKWIQATSNGNKFELRCLPQLPDLRRDDLAIPMSRMGAGIGNVIAMLYVMMTSRESQVIAIDEPNAFLHPKALRELLAILDSEGKSHQFIVTAHSADVLTSVNTQTISLLEFDGVTTAVKQVGSKDLHYLRGELAELGIRMTDLHAKDRVLWVEGQTEELVMPELLRWACPEVAAGTSILRVERTGTFDKKSIEPTEVASIYQRLSSSSALVPPMVCILLDGEARTKETRSKIETSSKGKLRFLDRKMLENYLLHSQAVVAVFNELEHTIDKKSVDDLLYTLIRDCNHDEIDGAAILRAIFAQLSNATLEFRKTRDVPLLVSWIIENDPNYLLPLRECLRRSFEM